MLGHEHGYFWNSQNHDRIYNADSFSEWLRYFFTTGVFFGTCYVQAERGMDVIVQKGYCNIEGKVRIFDQGITLTVSGANASMPRIDNVVIERNDTDRTFYVKIVEGTPARNPVAPVPERANGIYQLVIAQINVSAGATAITQAYITDTRPVDSVCGWVSINLQPNIFQQIFNQWSNFFNDFTQIRYDDFDEWFNMIKGQLSTDAAGNLQIQIDDNRTYLLKEIQKIVSGETPVGKAPTNEWKELAEIFGDVQRVVPEDAKEVLASFYLKGPAVTWNDNETTIHIPVTGDMSNVFVYTGGYYYSNRYYASFALDFRGRTATIRKSWTRVCDAGNFIPEDMICARIYYR